MDGEGEFEINARIWVWRAAPPAKGAWHFLTIEGQAAAEIRYAALGRTGGFGSVRVTATIGGTRWRTSLFPHRESGGFLLPIKADVRRAEGIAAGDVVTVSLTV
ncbi:DUF1905 domain-containing protein [Sphingomonas sp. LaA6.9]|uniref:DUF1905 domain-containing protein n=1 Tax=Sphingomonas sp. LaA6.9 TaxID=2919914 RepID=UPI001F4FA7A1|nr:DUF1905 domain-containing protein [Sphingomonas sp. LaA6.9]MCJ8156390.1 DUF1905 domain-containing protein [Sphingomonas sp. LaA6.9]